MPRFISWLAAVVEPQSVKIVAYKGETVQPDFFTDYCQAAGMLDRMREHLERGIRDNHPQVGQLLCSSGAPAGASTGQPSQGGSGTRPQFRAAPGGSSQDMTDEEPSDAESQVTLEEVAWQLPAGKAGAGRLVRLAFGSNVSVTVATQRTILTYLMHALEFSVRSATYHIVNDDGGAVIGCASADPAAEGEEILDSLTALPFDSFPGFLRINVTADSSELLETQKTDAKTFLTPFDPLPRNIMIQRVQDGRVLAWETAAAILPPPDPKRVLMWIPDALPLLFFDPVDSGTLYRPNANAAGRYIPATYGTTYNAAAIATMKVKKRKAAAGDAVVITGRRYPFYGVTADGKFWSASMSLPQVWPREGVGGQGAMRCDRATEFLCYARGSEGLLGRALGLAASAVQGRVYHYAQYLSYPLFSSEGALKNNGIGYSKSYTPGVAKKNQPTDTQPLSFRPPSLNPRVASGASRRRVKEAMKLSGFTMKQKGDRAANGITAGRRVGTPVSDRAAANIVMRDAMRARFGDAIGQQSFDNWQNEGKWQGSATKLVAGVFAEDPVASAFWAEQSEELVMADGTTAAGAGRKGVLRTGQEWCHLFGHGDGGEEDPDNFVSGSKHCNTEQLALELTQRLYRDDKPTVKITAYLMPSGLPVQAADWEELKTFPGIEAAIGAFVGPEAARPDRGSRLKTALGAYFDAYVGDENSIPRSFMTSEDVQIYLPGHGNAQVLTQAELKQERTAFIDVVGAYLFPVMPIAYMMRYKVYLPAGNASVKCIDHIYAGQREEMDYNEFQLLQLSFRLKIATMLDGNRLLADGEYAQVIKSINDRIAAS